MKSQTARSARKRRKSPTRTRKEKCKDREKHERRGGERGRKEQVCTHLYLK